jgi:hypothetical protein
MGFISYGVGERNIPTFKTVKMPPTEPRTWKGSQFTQNLISFNLRVAIVYSKGSSEFTIDLKRWEHLNMRNGNVLRRNRTLHLCGLCILFA